MNKPLLTVEQLSAGYGDIQVLWDVDVSVNSGEIVCLVGSNGAGKSTLLKTISGLIQPSSGRVVFDDKDLTHATAKEIVQAGIAHVPEGRRLFGPLTVLDNLLLGAYLRTDQNEIRRDVERMYEIFPILAKRRKQQAGTMSGGEQQMCAIARGLMARPRLLMIDELSLGLAPQVVEMLSDIITGIAKDGLAVLLVEQDVMTAFDLASKAVVIDTGKVSITGPTADLKYDTSIREAYMGLPSS
ncbi:MAG: branched-chain amino acid ABC transporter ATP-binding protein [Pusillimonas sp.]|nr:branched-chain amino acid ABC transporter ATP-binding protein [Pusillimonas sp.]